MKTSAACLVPSRKLKPIWLAPEPPESLRNLGFPSSLPYDLISSALLLQSILRDEIYPVSKIARPPNRRLGPAGLCFDPVIGAVSSIIGSYDRWNVVVREPFQV